MKKYIDFNAEKWMNAADNFEKVFLIQWSILFMEKQWKVYEKESVWD